MHTNSVPYRQAQHESIGYCRNAGTGCVRSQSRSAKHPILSQEQASENFTQRSSIMYEVVLFRAPTADNAVRQRCMVVEMMFLSLQIDELATTLARDLIPVQLRG